MDSGPSGSDYFIYSLGHLLHVVKLSLQIVIEVLTWTECYTCFAQLTTQLSTASVRLCGKITTSHRSRNLCVFRDALSHGLVVHCLPLVFQTSTYSAWCLDPGLGLGLFCPLSVSETGASQGVPHPFLLLRPHPEQMSGQQLVRAEHKDRARPWGLALTGKHTHTLTRWCCRKKKYFLWKGRGERHPFVELGWGGRETGFRLRRPWTVEPFLRTDTGDICPGKHPDTRNARFLWYLSE